MRSFLAGMLHARLLLGLSLLTGISVQAQTVATTTMLSIQPSTITTQQTVDLRAVVSPYSQGNAFSDEGLNFNYTDPNGNSGLQHVAASGGGIYGFILGPSLTPGVWSVQANYEGNFGHSYAYSASSSPVMYFTVTQPAAGAALKGQYAILFQGFTSAGSGPAHGAAAVASVTADGSGKITAGTLDLNTPQGAYEKLAVTGSYSLDTSGRGMMTLVSSQVTQTFEISVPRAQVETGVTSGTLMATGGGLLYGVGSLARQTPSAFTHAAVTGVYAFTGFGEDSPQATPALIFSSGQLTLDASENALIVLDQTIGSAVTVGTPASGSYTELDATTGRFLLTTTTGDAAESNHTVLYPVDATHLYLLILDSHASAELISGTAAR